VVTARQTFPKDAVNARVTATGTWDAGRRLLITDRELGGRKGFWVLVPLRLADGSALPVVRGWVASASDPAAAGPVGNAVTVIGLLQPSEPGLTRSPGTGTGLPADQLDRISAADLVNRWPYPLITGFLVEQEQTPATGVAPSLVPPPAVDGGLDLVNVSYAIQWWLFAVLGLLFWYRLVRDDHRGVLGARAPADPDPDPDDVTTLPPGLTADVSTVTVSSGDRSGSSKSRHDVDVRGRPQP
jgi:cytochrome oxidase assembly protein ShyY1